MIKEFSQDSQNNLRRAYKLSAVVGIAVGSSLLIYAVVVEIMKNHQAFFSGLVTFHDMRILRYIFYGLSIANVLILRIIRGILLRKSPIDDHCALITKLQKASILSTALCEGPALYGFILFLLGGMRRDFYFLLIVSLFLLFMYFPRRKNWQAWLEGNRS
jgi:hypothetical protein